MITKDIIVYNKETNEIITIISDVQYTSEILLSKDYTFAIEHNNDYSIEKINDRIYYRPKTKIINLDEYRGRNNQ